MLVFDIFILRKSLGVYQSAKYSSTLVNYFANKFPMSISIISPLRF